MIKKLLLFVFGCTVFLPASASQPGQPLDCSDWVFLLLKVRTPGAVL